MKDTAFPEEITTGSGRYAKEREYWLKQLAGNLVKVGFPYDYRKTADEKTMGKTVLPLDADVCSRAIKLSGDSDARLYIILVAGLIFLLNKYSYQTVEDVLVGAPTCKQDIEDDYINTALALRNRFHEEMTFKELLMQVRETTVQANENQNYPIETLLYKLNIPYSPGDDFPLFDLAILLTNIHDKRYLQGINLNMIFSCQRVGQSIKGEVEYNKNLYAGETVEQIAFHFNLLLRKVLFDVNATIGDVVLLTVEEKKRFLDLCNTGVEYAGTGTLHELFEKQVERTPDHIALVGASSAPWPHHHLTYRELNAKSNRLARRLRKKGAGPDFIAGIMVERSIEMVISILGILKAGGAYLPIDAGTPINRVILMLEDSGAPLLLVNPGVATNDTFMEFQSFNPDPGEKPRVTPRRPSITNLDELCIPDRSLVDYEKSSRFIGHAMVKNSITLQASRGCPYNCAYCHKIWPKKHIFRSASHIFDEVRLYYDMGIRRFSFIDDIFNLNVENSSRFFEMLIKNRMEVQIFFPNGVRGDLLNPGYIDLMVKAGTTSIALALETASPRVQKLIKKNLDIEKLREVVLYFCEKHPQVILELFTMHGFPTETEEEAMMTLDFIKSIKWLHFPYINILKIYPNTAMMKLAIENGISRKAIFRSDGLAHHQLSSTLPFDSQFTLAYQTDFLNEYFLAKERLLHVLPYQARVLTEDEIAQKYRSYLPMEVDNFAGLLQVLNIKEEELAGVTCAGEERYYVPNFNEKLRRCFPAQKPAADAVRILLLDLTQDFSHELSTRYNMVEQPLGLMYVLTHLQRELGPGIKGKICKSYIDFDNYEELKTIIEEFKPHVIGMRTIIFYKGFFHRTAAVIRSWGIDVPIIAGGPYATSSFETILQDRNFDLVVLGEGEITTKELMEQIIMNNGELPNEEILEKIQGLAFRHGNPGAGRNFTLAREIMMADGLISETTGESAENLEHAAGSDNLAYVLYTSGTTGKPKGVSIDHRSIMNYIQWAAGAYAGDETVSFPFYTSASFDLTLTSLFTPLVTGGRVVVYGEEEQALLMDRIVSHNNAAAVKLTPSHLKMIRYNDDDLSKSSIKRLVVGGEDLERDLALDIYKKFAGNVTIYNEYGPTEAAVGCMIYRFDPRQHQVMSVPIGKPIGNMRIYILDRYLRPVPCLVAGELCISGAGIARGYLNLPGLTCEKFNQDLWDYRDYHDGYHRSYRPYRSYNSKKIYRSGDLARWLLDGNVEFLGRIDNQVKIRGFRIEPGEIEHHLLTHRSVREAVVLTRENNGNEKSLCAYIVPGGAIEVSELADFCKAGLPAYMIPAYFMIIDRIPLTPNGKIDRHALPGPRVSINDIYIGPRSPLEEKLVKIWSEVLGVEKEVLGIDANFFDMGGNSLKATILAAKIHKELNTRLPLAELFKSPVLRDLAGYIKGLQEENFSPIHCVEKREYFPASSAQNRLYLIHLMEPGSLAYNIPMFFQLEGDVDAKRLEETFKQLIRRHESSRTWFTVVDDRPVQQVSDTVEFALRYHDLTGGAGSGEKKEQVMNSFVRPFDLARAPLLRAGLIKEENQKYILMVDMHHIISDGISADILAQDFLALYQGKELPALNLQYKDFSQWQVREIASGPLKKQGEYWFSRFQGEIPVLELPTDYPRPPAQDFQGHTIIERIDNTLTGKVQSLAAEYGATPYMVLLASFALLLSKYANQNDIIVGTPVAGRRHADLDGIVGMFVNVLLMRNSIAREKSFAEFLADVKNNTLKAFDNQDYPFDSLVEGLGLKRETGSNPLYEVIFALQNLEIREFNLPGLRMSPVALPNETVKTGLRLGVEEKNGELELALTYSTDLFKQETARDMLRHYREILRQAAANRKTKLEDIKISGKLAGLKLNPDRRDTSDFNF